MPILELDDKIKLNYVDVGEGDHTFLLIHGWTANLHRWDKQIEFLSKYYRVVAVDLRGHGESSKPLDVPYNIREYTADMIKLMDKLNIEKAIVAGHSMGGMIAQMLYFNQKPRVEGLILVGTTSKVVDNFAMKFNTSLAIFLMKVSYSLGYKIVLGRAFSNLTPKEEKEKHIREGLETVPKYVAINSFSDFVKNFDTRSKLKEITVPTLIIVGENDRMLPPRMSQFLHHNIRDSELSVIPDAGHEVMLEAPDEVNKAIDTFMLRFKE